MLLSSHILSEVEALCDRVLTRTVEHGRQVVESGQSDRDGAGFSGPALIGDRLYTQEQRGEIESVVCYES